MKRMIKREEKRDRAFRESTLIPYSFCYSVIPDLIWDPELEVTNCDLKIEIWSN